MLIGLMQQLTIKNTQTQPHNGKICFCFGTHGVRYFMNLEPEAETETSKHTEAKKAKWFSFRLIQNPEEKNTDASKRKEEFSRTRLSSIIN